MPFGEILGNPEGTTYPDRAAVRAAGIHAPLQAGIAGSARTGAEPSVVSGGYEDDQLEILDVLGGTSLGQLRTAQGQSIDPACARDHREHFGVE